MYPRKQAPKDTPMVINHDRVVSYMKWLIRKYGNYSSKKLLQKANTLFAEDTQYNQSALDLLIDCDIVNDLRYALRVTEIQQERNVGENKIKEKLYAKGFSSSIIEQCINSLEVTEDEYLTKALTLKQRKFGTDAITDEKTKNKALRHLIGKGFTFSVANSAVNYSKD